jgi:Raf kinase inhibitor-like YbhB/YbcL family protein
MKLNIDDDIFKNKEYACKDHGGDNVNPELSWTPVKNALSYALIIEDLDAHHYIHWYMPYINPNIVSIEKAVSGSTLLSTRINILSNKIDYSSIDYNKFNIVMGFNHHNTYGYFGPCAPKGTHKYQFTIFALNSIFRSVDGTIGGKENFEIICAKNNIQILDKYTTVRLYNKST